MISNLKQAIEFIHNHPQIKELKVPMKAYVRIRRDLKQLSFTIETPYTSVPKEDKWLWHADKILKINNDYLLRIPIKPCIFSMGNTAQI